MLRKSTLVVLIIFLVVLSGCKISGTVVDEGGVGVSGVIISFGAGGESSETIGDGTYESPDLLPMEYIVTPELEGCTFLPESQTVTFFDFIFGNSSNVDFVVQDFTVYFPDLNFETAIREAIDKPAGEIMSSDLLSLEELFASARNIVNIEGVQYCTNLYKLHLNNNSISDFSLLANLSNLVHLQLVSNQMNDISFLETMTSIEFLDFRHNNITNIEPLSELINLDGLYLSSNQISDISVLSELTNLTQLSIGSNNINNSDISLLSFLTKLECLYIQDNQISNTYPLSTLSNLTALHLQNNQISDISAVSGLTKLRGYIRFENNQIVDISPLVTNSGISSGTIVWLQGNPLNATSCNTHISELESRGVEVWHDCD